MNMQVRRAVPEEQTMLLELWERAVRASHTLLEDHDIVELRPLVAVELAGTAVEWWVVASDEDLPMGFMGYTPGTIEGLFIDPEHQGHGGGKLLIAHAQTMAEGALAVDVNEGNEAARGFYERQGFVVVGRSPTDSGGRPFPLLHMKRARPPG